MSSLEPKGLATQTVREMGLPAILTTTQAGEWDDASALASWLGFVAMRNGNTFRSYRKEVLRFRVYLHTRYSSEPSRPTRYLMRDATELDVVDYEAQMLGAYGNGKRVNPMPVPADLMRLYGLKTQPFVTYDPSGLPQPLALKTSSANLALSVLHALYEAWCRPDPSTKMAYVGTNPVSRFKRSRNRVQHQTERNFPPEAIQAIYASLERRARDAPGDGPLCARQRWIASLLYGLWGRRAEMANLRMRDFQHDGARWVVKVRRKGGKEQSLPVATWVMAEFMAYRESCGLSKLPSPQEDLPCIIRFHPGPRPDGGDALRVTPVNSQANVNTSLIYRDMVRACRWAAQDLRAGRVLQSMEGAQREWVAGKLDQVSPHWFRHSGASIAINSGVMSLEDASKMLGHHGTDMTQRMYYHPELNRIADGIEQLANGLFPGMAG